MNACIVVSIRAIDWSQCAGKIGAATDFVCKLNCKNGLAEVTGLTNLPLPPAGIFDPPYAINVNLTQIPIDTKVTYLSYSAPAPLDFATEDTCRITPPAFALLIDGVLWRQIGSNNGRLLQV